MHQIFPALAHECGGGVVGHLARLALIHALQHFDAGQQLTRRRRGLHGQRPEQDWRVAPELAEAVADQSKVVEVFRPGQSLRLADTLAEHLPRDDGFNGGERVAAGLLGVQQGAADA